MPVSIADLRRRRAEFIAEMKAIATKDAEDGDEADHDSNRFGELERMVEDHDGRIERLESVAELEAKAAAPVKAADDEDDGEDADDVVLSARPKAAARILHKTARKAPKGTSFARFAIGQAIGKAAGSVTAGARFVEDNFEDKTVAKALNSLTQAAGGALVPQDFAAEIVELLYAATVVRGAGARVMPMPYGNLTIPRLNGGATTYWIGETDDQTISQQTLDDLQFSAHKLVCMVPTSMDLVRRSPISVEAIVREDMVRQLALREDLAFLSGSGSSGVPTGMVNLALSGNKFTSTDTPSLSVCNNVLRDLELLLLANNLNLDNAVWFFNPAIKQFLSTLTDSTGRYFFADELNRGELLGHPLRMTNQLPTNLGGSTNQAQIMLVNVPDLIIADTMNMLVDSSIEATYLSSGSPVSAYSKDQMVFRSIKEMDFGVRHPASIAIATVTAWYPTSFTPAAGAPYATQPASTQVSPINSIGAA